MSREATIQRSFRKIVEGELRDDYRPNTGARLYSAAPSSDKPVRSDEAAAWTRCRGPLTDADNRWSTLTAEYYPKAEAEAVRAV